MAFQLYIRSRLLLYQLGTEGVWWDMFNCLIKSCTVILTVYSAEQYPSNVDMHICFLIQSKFLNTIILYKAQVSL